jgi:hypothetical protein
MNAILVTVFVGLMLVLLFVLLFVQYRRDGLATDPDRESLLPLAEEQVRLRSVSVAGTSRGSCRCGKRKGGCS